MDLKFSPVCNMMALSQVTGEIRVYSYTNTKMEELSVYKHHTESVRSIDFSPCGNILYASSKDMGFSVMSNGRVEGKLENCHSDAINKIAHLEGDHVIATGDDSGVVKIWDLRQAAHGQEKSCAMSFNEHEGSVSDFCFEPQGKKLLSVANDGMLGVWDLRKSKLYAMSDSLEVD